MAILELRILPPIAIARLGDSSVPLGAYDLALSTHKPLGYREIRPQPTFVVDPIGGAIVDCVTPPRVEFRDGPQIRPVAPFLEVFARTADDVLEPLNVGLLASEGLTPSDVCWRTDVGNAKIFRRTGNAKDRIVATTAEFRDHTVHDLLGRCDNFVAGRTLPLGHVRYIKPTDSFPEIRLRFTPAAGYVYGASSQRRTADGDVKDDPIFEDHPERLIYDSKGGWLGWREKSGPGTPSTVTNPGQIFAGYTDGNNQVSWGYFDDECDGVATVALTLRNGTTLRSRAVIGAGPPTFAPDALPIRTVADEVEQILLGSGVSGPVPIEEAEDILRRAFDTVRLMNTAVMNGNPIDGRLNVASTMVRQDSADFARRYEPIMAASLVDTLAVQALHASVIAALRSGTAAWFAQTLRRPEEIGDLTDAGRRKMPAMMRGADGRMLSLTRRQIAVIVRTAADSMFDPRHGARSTADRGAR